MDASLCDVLFWEDYLPMSITSIGGYVASIAMMLAVAVALWLSSLEMLEAVIP
jgi:hypothetical protein